MKLTKTILFMIFCSLYSYQVMANEVDFGHKHCVAWKTKKTMFLVKSMEPIGINCSIDAKFEKDRSGYYISVSAPIHKFNSGEPDRDSEVYLILQAKLQPNLLIRTSSKSMADWKSAWKNAKMKDQLTLKIGSKASLLNADVEKSLKSGFTSLKGQVKTTFSALSIEPPSVAGGLVASIDDYLELHFQLDVSKISGFEVVTGGR